MKDSGFTIVEVVISTFIFAIIGIIVGNIFVQSSNLQRRGFAAQNIQENMQFALEMMAREIRVADVLTGDSTCSAASLSISHPVNGSVGYSLSGGKIVRTEGGVATDITSSKVDVTRLNFCITGSSAGDDKPTKVTISLDVENRDGKEVISVPIQTTVTSRNIAEELQN